jgi:DNA ligase-1
MSAETRETDVRVSVFMSTPFKALAELGEKLEATKKRLLMVQLASAFLKSVGPKEIEPAANMLLGRPFPKSDPRTLDVSWAILSEIIKRIADADWRVFVEAFGKTGDVGAAAMSVFERSVTKRQSSLFEEVLTISEVRHSFEAIAEASGFGSREKKERLVEALLSKASPVEAKYVVKIFIGEMRTGFHDGLMEQTVSEAFEIPLRVVQEATMVVGDVGKVALIAKTEGRDGLGRVGFKVFRPVNLMLAQVAEDVSTALREHGGRTAFEFKYDGARVQIHKLGREVRVFSRRLTDVTESLPEVDRIARELPVEEVILEGEVVAVDSGGYPIPFQHLMRRFRRVHGVADAAERIPLRLYLFDVLYLDGRSLISCPYVERRAILASAVGEASLTYQIVTGEVGEAEAFLGKALDAGHEGLMVKKLDGPYTPGVRGKRWLKVKPILDPLDLVIVAAEWGYGRRHDWLSDYYLAARDVEGGRFLVVGKTFKGLTDVEIVEMTRRLKELTVASEPRGVTVLPKVVVEVGYNEVQRSPKYESRMALRFARILRVRYDKTAEEADTIQRVREVYEGQFEKKGRYTTG